MANILRYIDIKETWQEKISTKQIYQGIKKECKS